jgi:serine/threonine-protein kinase
LADAIPRLNAALTGRYRIERELGEGGMATVYLAHDGRHDRHVALKVLKPELAAVVGAARFLSEIRTTANLQHPHILPLFDSGEADGLLFYVMPYVEGESLRGRLDREHQLSVDAAVRIATDLAEALDYAHRRGVIHRDIKPANVLFVDGRAIVSDFGIALAISKAGSGRMTETGLSLGTPHYMSPEQATGDVAVGPASDIWALGCVLFEMLVGEPPYTGGTPQAILGRIITAEAPLASTHRRAVPAHVDAAIRTSLEKVPADRFGSAGDFAKALTNPAFQSAAVGATSRAPRRQVGGVAVGLGVVSAGLAAALAWITLNPTGPAARGPVTRLVLSTAPAAALVPSQLSRDVAISPDGEVILYRSRLDSGQFVVRRLEALETVPLRGPVNPQWPVFSPDGDFVAYYADGAILRIPISGGVPTTVADVGPRVIGMVWTAADSIVFGSSVVPHRGLQVVAAGGGAVTSLTETDGTVAHVHPSVLPGGAGMLFVVSANPRQADDDQIAVLDPATGEHRVILEAGSAPQYSPTGHVLYTLQRVLMAVPFDTESLTVTGNPIAVLDGVIRGFDGSSSFDLSATGSLVYAVGGSNVNDPRIAVWVDSEGGEEPLPLPPRRYLFPAVSPDGGQLAFSVAEDNADVAIWVFDDATAEGRPLVRTGENHAPVWMSDSTVALTRFVEGTLRIHTVATEGTAEPQLLPGSVGSDYPTSITPDGRFLFVTRRLSAVLGEIVRLPLRGDPAPEPIYQGELNRGNHVVSPDGRWLAYQSNRTGRYEVYVQAYPVAGRTSQVSIGGGATPAWSRDGRQIFYRSADQMMAVPFEASGEVGRPAELFRGDYLPSQPSAPRMYDVAADGRFIMLKSASTTTSTPVEPQVVLVQNWYLELAERVPR